MTSTWAGESEAKPAPGGLRRIQAFINTVDLESGRDRLAQAENARRWLVDNDLLGADGGLDAADLDVLVDVRESLRALVVHNGGGPAPEATAIAALRQLTAGAGVRTVVDEQGRVALLPEGDSLRARMMSLLLILRDAQLDGTWRHLKACANDDCRWAFYDRSRNHGGTWCDMTTCGNKLKNRDFRARKRGESV